MSGVHYRRSGSIGVGKRLEGELRGIAVGSGDRIFAVGDSRVLVLGSDGELLREWPSSLPGHCVAQDGDGRVWVGQFQQVELFDERGELLDTWKDPERLGLVTAIALTMDAVFLADASARWIRRYDRKGNFLNDIGAQHRKGGFHIPNGAVDFVIDDDGILHVANPGMHRVERYRPDGEYLDHFGRFDGRNPEGFPGCCNPTNLALDLQGRVLVTEKASPRVKLYGDDGTLLQVLADDGFDAGAKNMDIAVDSTGRVYVADNVTFEIHIFERGASEGQR